MSYLNKEDRQKCWSARDSYWLCLDKNAPNHSSTSGEEVPKVCVGLRKLFEKECPGQWVKHFDRRRNYEMFKEKMKKGFDPLERDQTAQ